MKLTYTFGLITLTIFTASVFGAEDPHKILVPADKNQVNQRDRDGWDDFGDYLKKDFDQLFKEIGKEFRELEEEGRKRRAEWDKKFEVTSREFDAISAGLPARMEREKQEAMRKADERACKAAQEWSALLILILESQRNNASAM